MDVRAVIEEFKTLSEADADEFFGRLLEITPEYSGSNIFTATTELAKFTSTNIIFNDETVSLDLMIPFIQDNEWAVPLIILIYAVRIYKWNPKLKTHPNIGQVLSMLSSKTEIGNLLQKAFHIENKIYYQKD